MIQKVQMGKQWEGCPLILFLGYPPLLSTGNQCYQLIENPPRDILCTHWYKQTWIFSLLVLSPNHFSDSLLSIPTALVWLLRCFGPLPALHFRLHFSQSSFYTSLFILLKDPSLHRRESSMTQPGLVTPEEFISCPLPLPVMHLARSFS